MHMLVCLADEDAPKTVDDFDKFVSARIPDPEKEPELYHLVTTFMIHSKCGKFQTSGPKRSCCKNGKCCRWHFPHDFVRDTKSKCTLSKLSSQF